MKLEEFDKLFEIYEDEYIRFENVKNKLSSRPDLHAFILLDSLLPGDGGHGGDIVAAAEHDEVWLDIDVEKLVDVINEEQVVDLIRCGIRFNGDPCEGLCMFV